MPKKPDSQDEIVVFSIVRDSSCSECGRELCKREFLRMENGRPLCMECADLDHLVFLPRGNGALTRRSSKQSTLRAVVVRFSRTRKRYERQGILVEEAALEQAERECLADADAREFARKRAADRRAFEDKEYLSEFAGRIGDLYPGCAPNEQVGIAQHACAKYSGRVGRSASAKDLDASAIDFAVRAHVRHARTSYDELLARGVDRHEARGCIRGELDEVLSAWRHNASDEPGET